jgi:hypothetical protein
MRRRTLIIAVVLVLSVVATGLALARPDATDMARSVLSGGASNAAAPPGGVTLRGTFGQPFVGTVATADGAVTLGHGFWHGGTILDGYRVYLPIVLSSP